jgi:hypothetical protein
MGHIFKIQNSLSTKESKKTQIEKIKHIFSSCINETEGCRLSPYFSYSNFLSGLPHPSEMKFLFENYGEYPKLDNGLYLFKEQPTRTYGDPYKAMMGHFAELAVQNFFKQQGINFTLFENPNDSRGDGCIVNKSFDNPDFTFTEIKSCFPIIMTEDAGSIKLFDRNETNTSKILTSPELLFVAYPLADNKMCFSNDNFVFSTYEKDVEQMVLLFRTPKELKRKDYFLSNITNGHIKFKPTELELLSVGFTEGHFNNIINLSMFTKSGNQEVKTIERTTKPRRNSTKIFQASVTEAI